MGNGLNFTKKPVKGVTHYGGVPWAPERSSQGCLGVRNYTGSVHTLTVTMKGFCNLDAGIGPFIFSLFI